MSDLIYSARVNGVISMGRLRKNDFHLEELVNLIRKELSSHVEVAPGEIRGDI